MRLFLYYIMNLRSVWDTQHHVSKTRKKITGIDKDAGEHVLREGLSRRVAWSGTYGLRK